MYKKPSLEGHFSLTNKIIWNLPRGIFFLFDSYYWKQSAELKIFLQIKIHNIEKWFQSIRLENPVVLDYHSFPVIGITTDRCGLLPFLILKFRSRR